MSRDISLVLIDRDEAQPRQHFDEAALAELAQSMAAKGLVVPIMVRPTDERFTVVHGERRRRAALSLGWETIRAEVRDVSADEAHWLALIENVQRQDLSPIEEARAYKARLAEGITQAELGARIGKSQSYVAQKLRLLRLPEDVQSAVAQRQVTEGHARQLLKLKEPERQSELCREALAQDWTVAETQTAVDMALPLTPEEQAELDRCEKIIGDYLATLRVLPGPPNRDNLLEVAIWAEQRMAYLNAHPTGSLLERHNELVTVRLELERAAGGGLVAMEEGRTDWMTHAGLYAVLNVMEPGRAKPNIFADMTKRLSEVCPGIELSVGPPHLRMPEDCTFEQWKQVGHILEQIPSGDPQRARGRRTW